MTRQTIALTLGIIVGSIVLLLALVMLVPSLRKDLLWMLSAWLMLISQIILLLEADRKRKRSRTCSQ